MLNSIKQTLKVGDALVFTADEAKKFAKLCQNASYSKQIVASAFLGVSNETLETCQILATLNIVNSSKGRIFEDEGVNDSFIAYLYERIKRGHFLDNMLKICYASAGDAKPNKDEPTCIVDKVKIIRQFLFNNLRIFLHDVIINQDHTDCKKISVINSAVIFGCDINALDAAGRTALMYAAWRGNTDITSALLQHKEIDVNIQDNIGGCTALICSVRKGYTDIAKELLQRKEIDLSIRDHRGKTALRIAIEEDSIKIIQLLVQKLSKDSGIDIRTLLQTELQVQTIQINQQTVKLPAINTTTPEELIQKFTTDTEIADAATELVESEMLSASKEDSNCSMSF